LHDEVVAGEGRPLRRSEPTDGRVDDASVAPLNRLVIQVEALKAAGLEIFDEDIGTRSQFVCKP